jgi:RNA recognition motif-containing protein
MGDGFPSDNLYFQNLPSDMTVETISSIFGAIGYRVTQAKIMPPTKPGVSTCAAMVRFVSVADAKFVLDNFNDTCLPGFEKPLSISYATKQGGASAHPPGSGPAAMAAALAAMMGGGGGGYGKAPVEKPAMLGMQGVSQPYLKTEASNNLYIKGLPGTADEAFVEQLFNQYGTVQTVKVLKKGDGPNCHAMVRFATAEEASTIISTLNGGMLEGFTTALEISYAQSKTGMANSGMGSMMGLMGGDGGFGGGSDDLTTQQMLDEWVKCKRTRDYATADSLRAQLRAQGVDPDTERPKAW